jgi:thiol-disulfide isomerase/thioredoxin
MSSAMEQLLGADLVGKDGPVKTAEVLAGKEAVALYFSAHWCPPCRQFTPQLAQSYQANLQTKGLEVVFVSSDQDETSFQEYFGSMPWLALPFNASELKQTLGEKFGVQGIPMLVVLDANGEVITKDGRSMVSEDPAGENFPWRGHAAAQAGEMKRASTKQLMENSAQAGPCTAICMAACCFWIPLLCFLGAANLLETCESDHFGVWLKVYGLLPLSSAIVVQCVAAFWARKRSKEHFKNALRLQGFTSLVMFGMFIWGWVEYAKTTEDACVGAEDVDVNPRKLALAFLIMGSIGAPCALCSSIKTMRNPTNTPEAPPEVTV